MLIKNLAGVFTGLGFVDCDGRRPRAEHCGFAHGPTSIAIDDSTGLIASSAASDAQIDGSGMIALPGFIDPHTHAIFAGERSHEYFMRWAGKTYLEISQGGAGIHSTVAQTLAAGDDDLRDTLRKRLSEMLACGATTVEVK
ncbi:MAG: hypothetical protein ACREJC_11610, partial [Tepidisphaeraceae bacterium]